MIVFVLILALCSAGETGFIYSFCCRWAKTWLVLYISLRLFLLLTFELYHVQMGTVCSRYDADILECVFSDELLYNLIFSLMYRIKQRELKLSVIFRKNNVQYYSQLQVRLYSNTKEGNGLIQILREFSISSSFKCSMFSRSSYSQQLFYFKEVGFCFIKIHVTVVLLLNLLIKILKLMMFVYSFSVKKKSMLLNSLQQKLI